MSRETGFWTLMSATSFSRWKDIQFLMGLTIICCLSSPTSAFAQASLAAENMINDVVVHYKTALKSDETITFTLLRDFHNSEQWYYVPSTPRLTTITTEQGSIPEIHLLRYSKRDKNDSQVFNGGGLIQFAVDLAAPPEAVDELRKTLADRALQGGAIKDIRVSALPFKSASVAIYRADNGSLIGATPLGEGVAPVFANQKMVFSIPLTELGSDVYEQLLKGTTGLPIVVTYKFNGLTAPAGFKVEVNWEQAYSHYSKNEEFRAQASYYGLWGGSGAYSSTKIREELEGNKVIKVSVVEGEGLSQETINSYLQPIVKRINDELLVAMQPPAKIDPAVAPGTNASGWFGSASYSVAVKDIKTVKTGTEVVDFNYSKLQERETLAAGFVNLAKYPKNISEQLITVVDNSNWERAYFSLPPVPAVIENMDMTVRLRANEKTYDSQFYRWSRGNGWKDENNKSVDRAVFSLLPLKASVVSLENVAKFDIEGTIIANDETLKVNQSVNVVNDGASVAAPKSAVNDVTIDPSGLEWAKFSKLSKLERVTVNLAFAGRTYDFTFRPIFVGDKFVAPPITHWIIKKPEKDSKDFITAVIKFKTQDGEQVWQTKNLLEKFSSLEIFLEDLITPQKIYNLE